VNDSFLKKTIKMWQPYSDQELTEEDAREIIQNLAGFFDLLAEWERKDQELKSKSRQMLKKAHEYSKVT